MTASASAHVGAPRSSWTLAAGVTAARLYIFATLYLFFLSTEAQRNERFFLLLQPGQSREAREKEIEERFAQRLAPFDGQFYLDVARYGYRTISSSLHGDLGNYAFFPLLPALLWSLEHVVAGLFLEAAIAVILAAGIAGTLAVWKLAASCRVPALLSVAVLICFPSAPFQYVLYTEGIFLCLSALALLFAVERRPAAAGITAALASLCRPQGILLALPIFVELLWPALREGGLAARIALRRWLAAAAPLAGFIVMAIASRGASGSPLGFLTVQGRWGRSYEATGVLDALTTVFGYDGPPLDLLGLVVGLGCLPIMWRRLRPSLALYGTAAVVMPLATGSILSLSRFMSVSIPHILALAILLERRSRRGQAGLLVAALVLEALVARGIVGWYFVG